MSHDSEILLVVALTSIAIAIGLILVSLIILLGDVKQRNRKTKPPAPRR